MSPSNPSILVAEADGKAYIKVMTKGSFLISPQFKSYYQSQTAAGIKHFVVDLTDCPSMDSTFLGTLSGLTFTLKKVGGGSIRILNANERNIESFKSLGIDRLFDLQEGLEKLPDLNFQPATPVQVTKTEATQTSLEAHETLVAADKDNEKKFKDVINLLKEDLADKSK